MPTIIDLIRHGTPEGGNLYRGHSIDDPLSEKGWQQMWNAVEHMPPWDAVVTSPMLRCKAFADQYAAKYDLEVCIDERLKEVGFGEWEGKSSQEILNKNPQAIVDFYHDPVRHRPVGAELLSDFQQRVSQALSDIKKNYFDHRILVVAHAGVIRAAITVTLKAPEAAMYRISISNAAIISLRDDGVRPPTLML